MGFEEVTVYICRDIEEAAEKGAAFFVDIARQFIAQKGLFTSVLSGGSTPEPLYKLLSSDRFFSQIDWPKVHLFWGDERCVPATDEASNYGMAEKYLLSKIDIPLKNIHRIKGEVGEDAACLYEKEIKDFFNLRKDAFPEFDLILLGIGEDGHTASLFPGSPVLEEREDIVAAAHVDKLDTIRITLTPPTINNASNILLLASGAKKADAIKELFEGDYRPDIIPSQLLRKAKGKIAVLIDDLAASKLSFFKE